MLDHVIVVEQMLTERRPAAVRESGPVVSSDELDRRSPRDAQTEPDHLPQHTARQKAA